MTVPVLARSPRAPCASPPSSARCWHSPSPMWWAPSRPPSAATLFSDDFEDGNSTGWTTSGGSWSVVTDGSRVLRQSGTSSDARARAGTSSWTDYAVTARVRPTAFNGSNRFVAVLARAQSNTSYYYLALRSNNTVELKKLVNGSSTTLATASVTVTVGTWYTLRLEVSGSIVARHRQRRRGHHRHRLAVPQRPDRRGDVQRHRVLRRRRGRDRRRRNAVVTGHAVELVQLVEPARRPRPEPGRRVGVGERLGPERHHRWRRRADRHRHHRGAVPRRDRGLRSARHPGQRHAVAARADARRHLRQDDRRRRRRTPVSPAAA